MTARRFRPRKFFMRLGRTKKEPRERKADDPIQYEISNIHVGSAKGSKGFYSRSHE